jgi:hypothetical protein
MTRRRSNADAEMTAGCLLMVAWVCLGATIDGRLFDYVLYTVAGKGVPWYADVVAGAICGGLLVPAAVITWILTLCGVPTPFFGG